ncbi:MAG TPA: hypothetical protein PLX06_00770 [Fimbriimonadaceae bacterium]|nr:hypothetical protein [Fimbriimonadaceae bacterium]
MKRFLTKGVVRAIGLLMLLACSPALAGQNPLTFNWETFGKTMNRGPKFIPDAKLAKKVVENVAAQLIRMNVPPNHNLGGRMVSGGKYGQLDVGTCTWINNAVQKALLGAGFRKDQIFGVVGHASLPSRASFLWVNQDHITPALVLNNKLITFDLWSHAFHTGSYQGMANSRWNGMLIGNWVTAVEDYVNFSFARFGQNLLNGPWDADYLQDEAVKDQNRQRFPIKGRRERDIVKPKPPPAKPKFEPYWEFVEVNSPPIREDKMPDPRRFFRTLAQGGLGVLTVKSSWNDMELKVHSCASAMTWTLVGDHRKLKPGQKIGVKGNVAISGEVDRSFWGMHWHPPGYPAGVSHTASINIGGEEFFGVGASKAFEKLDIVVPDNKLFPDGRMALRFITGARGYGSVEYIYRWVDK